MGGSFNGGCGGNDAGGEISSINGGSTLSSSLISSSGSSALIVGFSFTSRLSKSRKKIFFYEIKGCFRILFAKISWIHT